MPKPRRAAPFFDGSDEREAGLSPEPIYPEDASFPPPELFSDSLEWVALQDDGERAPHNTSGGFPRKMPDRQSDKI